jgi:NADPH2:quinone reductase
MKAIIVREFGEPEVMKLEQTPDPVPGPGQVVVRVKAAGVNPVDAYLRTGGAYGQLPPPYTPGMDAAGTVEAVGPEVMALRVGERVYTSATVSGSYAELALCEQGQVHPLPESATFAQGAALGIAYGTAYRALFQSARALPGETVLVHGATGGVGLAAVQLALAAGMPVIATGGSEAGRKMLGEQGVTVVLDHDDPGHMDQALAATDGRGVDVILENAAHFNLGKDLPALAPGGRVAVIGCRGPVEINPRDLMGPEATIVGVYLRGAQGKAEAEIHAAIQAGLANLVLSPVVGLELPLAEAPRAHHAVMEEKALGKIVLIP